MSVHQEKGRVATSRGALRVLVVSDDTADVLPLVEALAYVDCLPLLAVNRVHADLLQDCDLDAALTAADRHLELSLADGVVLRRWPVPGPSPVQVALGVRDTLLASARTRTLDWGPLELRPRLFQARWRGAPLHLSSLQMRLLTQLVAARGAVVTRHDIARRVFGDDFDRSGDRLDAHVRRLRVLLEVNPARPRFLLTVRGEGLRLADLGDLDDDGGPFPEAARTAPHARHA